MSTPTGDGAHAASDRTPAGDANFTDRHNSDQNSASQNNAGQNNGRGMSTNAGQSRQQTGDDTPQVLHHNTSSDTSHDTTRDAMDRASVVNREKNAHGGVKVGSAFFGWLTATGTAVLLTALLAATGTAIGVASSGGLNQALTGAQDSAGQNAATIGVAGAIGVLVVLLVAYFCGGYVAGRMARFNGVKQGIAVWVWAIVIAVVVAVAAAVAGSKFDVLGQLNSFPRIPVDAGSLTTGSIIALVAAVVVALLGAILGGLAGMRFHRRVDRAGLGR
ncbi:hypothetical protein OG218_01660 [Kineococcus sp. NBC_00420]|uniref:hypothetical protein n=1 Tax=Kineococcus sp. NBC_00420 TaxID=2903564 RepID=UPI002E21C8D8